MRYQILFTIVFFFFSLLVAKAQDKRTGFYTDAAEQLQSQAQEEGKPYVVELNATWCGFCKLFERETLKDPNVIDYINQNYLMATMDGEEGHGKLLNDRYKIKGFPALLFFNSEGKLMGKMIGYQDAEQFLYNLQHFKAKYDKKYAKKK